MENLTIKELIEFIKNNWERPDVFYDIDDFLIKRTPINLLLFAQEIHLFNKSKKMTESIKTTIGKATFFFKSKEELIKKLDELKLELESGEIIIDQSQDGIMISRANGFRLGNAGLTL